jgi:hypothetical protein
VEVSGIKRRSRLLRLLTFALFGAAVATEAAKPPEEREGFGSVGGVVPYDFRAPTFERIKERMWNPDDDRIFVPAIFGVGWTVNFARVSELIKNVSG